MKKTGMLMKKAGRPGSLTAVFVCLNIFLLSGIGGFFYLNLQGAFFEEKESRIFGAVFPDTADAYYREILLQLDTGIGAEGDLLLSRDCGNDIDLQGRQILELAEKGAEVIFVCPAGDRGLQDVIRECAARDTRVILVGRICEGAETAYASVTSDDERAGEMLAGYIDVEVKSARILLLGREGDASSRARIEGFQRGIFHSNGESPASHLRENGRKQSFRIVRQVQAETGEREIEGAWSCMRRELRRGRDFDLVFAADGNLAAGAYAALEEAGEEGRIRIVAVDGSPFGKHMLRSSGYLAAVMEYPGILSAEAVRLAYSVQPQNPGSQIRTQVKLVTKNIIYSYDIDKWE